MDQAMCPLHIHIALSTSLLFSHNTFKNEEGRKAEGFFYHNKVSLQKDIQLVVRLYTLFRYEWLVEYTVT